MTDIMKQYNQLQRAYEAQAEENADLALLADQYKAERDALTAKLDELQWQEPIGFVIKDSDYTNSIIREQGGHYTQPVYAAPKALEPLTQTQVVEAFCNTRHNTQYVSVFDAGVRFAEKHHGITKGTPT